MSAQPLCSSPSCGRTLPALLLGSSPRLLLSPCPPTCRPASPTRRARPRPAGEDKLLQLPSSTWQLPGAQPVAFSAFGIFDGHGGKQAATFASKNLHAQVRPPQGPRRRRVTAGLRAARSTLRALRPSAACPR